MENGLFLFDICTVYNSKKYFSNRSEGEECSGFKWQRKMFYNSRKHIQENHFDLVFDEFPDKVFTEIHLQRVYKRKEIKKGLKKAGLYLLAETDEFKRRSPVRSSLRIHFLCREV